MATVKISALTAASAANLTGVALTITTDKNTNSVGVTYAQLRTALLVGGTGYASTDSLVLGGSITGVTTLATSSTINGQTISAAANFTGTLTVASNITQTAGTASLQAVTATTIHGTGAATIDGGLTVSAGGITVNAGTSAFQTATFAGGLTVTAGTVSSTGSDLYVQNDSAAIYLKNGTPSSVGGFFTDFRWAGGSKTDTAFAALGTLKLYAGNSATPTIAITNTTLGLYGVTPVARQLLATGVSHTVDDVITVLQAVGLARQV